MFPEIIFEKITEYLTSSESLKSILPASLNRAGEIELSVLRKSTSYKKIIVTCDNNKYLVHVSLNIKKIKRIISMLTMLQENDINVPKIIAPSVSRKNLTIPKYHYLILEFINGERADKVKNDTIIVNIAKNIGKLHAISSTRAGYLLHRHNKSKEIVWFPENGWSDMEKQLIKYPEFTWQLPIQKYRTWFNKMAQIFRRQGPFKLLHGDLHGGNIIVEKNLNPVLLDFESMHYGYPALELFRCLMATYCRHSPAHQQLFLNTYRKFTPEENWNLWQDNTSAIAGFGILKQIKTWLTKSKKAHAEGNLKKSDIYVARSLDYWFWLNKIIVSNPKGQGEWPSIMAQFSQDHKQRAKKIWGKSDCYKETI